ncbi:MAG TPA: hypothetical protein VHG32_03335 [Thermoanaerobaculia bacterium]|nr:hypothetical protein [Thermoanaerobaculia bacterium]
MSFDRVTSMRKSGRERFRDGAADLGFDLQSFWQWSGSDLLSNSMRGVLAEYVVARALRANPDGVRTEWASYDLTTEGGTKVEVKSAGYLQSWHQERLSRISFVVAKRRPWDASTNRTGEMPGRQADVYVFALLAHQDKATVDPMDVGQWTFYVLPTSVLDERTRSQHSITLPTLARLCGRAVEFSGLRNAVVEATQCAAGRR